MNRSTIINYTSIRKIIACIIISSILISCNSKKNNKIESNTNHYDNPINKDSKIKKRDNPIIEFSKLKNLFFSAEDVLNHKYIKAYGIECPNECSVKSLFTNRTENIVELNKNKFTRLISILNDPNSYGAVTSACYHPSVGIITYDEDKNPLSYIGICLTCNNHQSNIGANTDNDYKYGYSQEGRKLLRSFLHEIGFDESETISSFDYKADRIKYLESKEMSKSEIEKELVSY